MSNRQANVVDGEETREVAQQNEKCLLSDSVMSQRIDGFRTPVLNTVATQIYSTCVSRDCFFFGTTRDCFYLAFFFTFGFICSFIITKGSNVVFLFVLNMYVFGPVNMRSFNISPYIFVNIIILFLF